MKGIHKKSNNRRNEIIQAGLKCFTEKGFTETTMAEICREANASTGSVYHHYKSKDQLAAAVYLEGITTFQQGFTNTLLSNTSSSEGIHSAISYYINWVVNNPDWAKFLFYQRHADFMQKPNQKLYELNTSFIRTIMGWYASHAKAGKFKALSWDLLMPLLFGPCQDYAKYYLGGLPVSPVEEAIETFADAAWESMRKVEKI